ncbi:MAG TPA: phage tail tape measure protein, partial [Streptosporangiaceae bacterium]
MATKELEYRIGADYKDLLRNTDQAIAKSRLWRRELREMEQQQAEHRQIITDLGAGLMTFGAVVTAGLGLAAKAAMEWESAFTGVRKTVDGSDAEIAALEGELRQLARTLPATHTEIAAVAEAAGQLGIKRNDIAAFTRVMIDLGNTTNLTADEAATELAKLANIMGTSAKDADRLGSALVALGNDGASTEKDILSMALRIAGAGKTIGITEAEVLGFASALSSVGIEAEAGGSSISRVMITVEQAVREGGDALEGFAEVAGLSADEFARRYKNDAAGAIAFFISGLSRMQAEGKNVFATLEQLGFGEILVRDALLRTAGASDMLNRSLQVGTSAWAENNALTEEANKRYETSASKLQVASNQIKDAAIDVGAAIGPILVGAAENIAGLVSWYQQLPGPLKEVVTYTALAAAGIGLVGGAALIAVPKVLAFRESMRSLDEAGGVLGKATSRFGLFMSGPWGAAIGAGVTLLGLFGVAAGQSAARQERLAESGRSVADAINEQNGAINANVKAAAAKAAEDQGLLRLSQQLGLEGGLVVDSILKQGTAYDTLIAQLDEVIRVRYQGGQAAFDEGEAAIELKDKLVAMVGAKDSELAATKRVAEAQKGATGASREQAEALEKQKQAADQAKEALDAMVESLDKLNGVQLTFNEANRRYIEQVAESAKALAENGKTLDINTEAGRANARALDDQAKAAYDLAEAAARQAEKTGGATAGQGAFTASLQASRAALIETATRYGMTREQAEAYTNSVLGIPTVASTQVITPGSVEAQVQLQHVHDKVAQIPPGKTVNVGALTAAAMKLLTDLGYKVETLPDGTVDVTANTAAANTELNRFLTQPATKVVQIVYRGQEAWRTAAGTIYEEHGGLVSFFAGGGFSPMAANWAQMVPAKTYRVIGDRAAGDEAYIPILPGSARSQAILAETNRRMGWGVPMPSYPVSSSTSRHVDASFSVGTLVVSSPEEAL